MDTRPANFFWVRFDGPTLWPTVVFHWFRAPLDPAAYWMTTAYPGYAAQVPRHPSGNSRLAIWAFPDDPVYGPVTPERAEALDAAGHGPPYWWHWPGFRLGGASRPYYPGA